MTERGRGSSLCGARRLGAPSYSVILNVPSLCHSERQRRIRFPPSLCMTGILPQSPSVTAPSRREPRTRDADSSAFGLRMTRWGVVLLCVGRDDPARHHSSPLKRELSGGAGLKGRTERNTASLLCDSERSEESVFPVPLHNRKAGGRGMRILRPLASE